MLRRFWKLSWLEIKIFLREPLGVIGSLGVPVVLFVLLGEFMTSSPSTAASAGFEAESTVTILAALFIAIGAVVSLIAIISIYREGGILKRLRATPLRPTTILGAHVVVKLMFTSVALGLLVLAGRRFFPSAVDMSVVAFTLALLIGTLSILSIGFIVASLVPTARFAQPLGSVLLYPMIPISGLFFPVELLPTGWRVLANMVPTTHTVTLLQGVWDGASWTTLLAPAGALVTIFLVATWIASRVFRWE